LELASNAYPNPNEVDKDGKKVYKTYEEMLPQYTFALGGTDLVKKFKEWMESQPKEIELITKRVNERGGYKI